MPDWCEDPSLRGLAKSLVEILSYAQLRKMPLDTMAPPLNLAAATLEGAAQGHVAEFSWKAVLQGDPRPLDLHRYIEIWPVLEQRALEPGGRATAAIRDIIDQLGLRQKFGAETILTGPVIISDKEFAGVREGIVFNSIVTGVIILAILWLALRSLRLVGAVAVESGGRPRDHRGRRHFDGRSAEPDLACVCRPICWPRC